MRLDSFVLSSDIVKALIDKGYSEATNIQKALIPEILKGRDVIAGAKTGTGKTAGFVLPILHNIDKNYKKNQHYPRAIIVVPTRELATQVHKSVEEYGKYLPLKSILLYGGANLTSQANRLKNGIDIVVATSGRLLEHINRKNIDIDAIEYLVLDEADTILDMGFLPEVSKIISHLPTKRQTILTSATLSGGVKRLSHDILKKPKLIEVDSMGSVASSVTQIVYPVELDKKSELLSYLIGSRNYKQVLVFVRKKEVADKVTKELNLSGLKTSTIHGGRSVGDRSRALEGFKDRSVRVLVATDIAARGLDIPSLEVVINYDIPHIIGDFIHRVGRTGRAGADGLAITLIAPTELVALKDVERLIEKRLPQERLDGYAPKIVAKPKGARKSNQKPKNIDGAFGKKRVQKASPPKNKKRKTTKRDGFKALDKSKKR